jgi:hypothetical protein
MISFVEIQAGAAVFHAQHNALHPTKPLDTFAEEHPLYLSVLLHDYLHSFFGFSTEDEDLLARIETRLSADCTSLEYLKEYTDLLPEGFLELWKAYG